ncbi:hypothetical protein J2T13_000718 [Paenibacillus sp. DS2015]
MWTSGAFTFKGGFLPYSIQFKKSSFNSEGNNLQDGTLIPLHFIVNY